MYKANDVRVETVPDARLVEPTDALLRVTRACICGSELWPSNLMEPEARGRPMGHEAIGVVDWEGAQEGTALIDIVQLATNWLDAARGATDERAKLAHYGDLFLSGDGVGAAARGARAAIGTYLSRLGMDARLLPLLVLASWLELAERRHDQRRAHGEDAGDARADNRAIPFIALLARQPGRLFGDAVGGPAA